MLKCYGWNGWLICCLILEGVGNNVGSLEFTTNLWTLSSVHQYLGMLELTLRKLSGVCVVKVIELLYPYG